MKFIYAEVEKCEDCPYCAAKTEEEFGFYGGEPYVCRKADRKTIGDLITIQEGCPPWCPLGSVVR